MRSSRFDAPITMTFFSFSAVQLGEELGDDGGLDVGRDPAAPGAEQRVHLVEEDDDGHTFLGLLLGPLKDQPDLALSLAHVLVEQLGALDVEEIGAGVAAAGSLRHARARLLATALAISVLPQPGGP